MDKKIVLVTGASSGIGKQTAHELLKKGYFVIIHGRNEEKTRTVFEEIKRTGNTDVDMVCADLSLKSEIKKMADEISQKYDRLDVLINNAGGQFGNVREETSEGHEKTFAINAIAPFLLTKLLLPLLQRSEHGRVITVSSASYAVGKFDSDDIELKNGYSLTRSYGLSKRYAYWIMLKYASLNLPNVTFNTVEPGSTDSDLGRVSRKSKFANLVYCLWKPMMWSVEKAAATSVYMATSGDVENVNGEFYGNLKRKSIKEKYKRQNEIDGVWNYCMECCNVIISEALN